MNNKAKADEEEQRLNNEILELRQKIVNKKKMLEELNEKNEIKNEELVKLQVKKKAIQNELKNIRGDKADDKKDSKKAEAGDGGKSDIGGKSAKSGARSKKSGKSAAVDEDEEDEDEEEADKTKEVIHEDIRVDIDKEEKILTATDLLKEK